MSSWGNNEPMLTCRQLDFRHKLQGHLSGTRKISFKKMHWEYRLYFVQIIWCVLTTTTKVVTSTVILISSKSLRNKPSVQIAVPWSLLVGNDSDLIINTMGLFLILTSSQDNHIMSSSSFVSFVYILHLTHWERLRKNIRQWKCVYPGKA